MSGIASVKALDKLGKKVSAYDSKEKESMGNVLEELKGIDVNYYFNSLDFDTENIEYAIKSPGIKYETPVIQKLIENNVKIIGDLEAGFMVTKNEFVAITGTNGKTTITTLIGQLAHDANKNAMVTGNIGSGVFFDAFNAKNSEILIVEASSFQLDSTFTFKPHISIITNLTPDHLDWHKTEENYYNAKLKVAINQNEEDYCILNYDDELLKQYAKKLHTNICYFSSTKILESGIYVENDMITYNFAGEKSTIMNVKEIFIPGKHNLENILAACAAAKLMKIDNTTIKKTIKNFRGVEHRLEYVETYNGVKFYNDSKGTNPDSSIKAIQGIQGPIIIIAGGYDKNSDYDGFINSFDNKVKAMILLGQTKENIKNCALNHGFNKIYMVETMDEAVRKSYELSEKGDTVLLSPACASWGMYLNYEVRGKDFKERVKFYGENTNI
ncbi:UDP-N-acetylmuramoyl-L-alanine--D-glutamate ligase [Sedimentibacter sp. zth1]|nr:UDP-N-acetylmuramoyl-L-alanine--D-glutamate ligase [Sedimentibacter sp. zth1]